MVTDLHKGVFSQILLNMTENDHKFKLQSFRITAIAFKLLGIICRFLYFSESNFIWLGLPDFREGQVENLG